LGDCFHSAGTLVHSSSMVLTAASRNLLCAVIERERTRAKNCWPCGSQFRAQELCAVPLAWLVLYNLMITTKSELYGCFLRLVIDSELLPLESASNALLFYLAGVSRDKTTLTASGWHARVLILGPAGPKKDVDSCWYCTETRRSNPTALACFALFALRAPAPPRHT
jgi:hypothetical protein